MTNIREIGFWLSDTLLKGGRSKEEINRQKEILTNKNPEEVYLAQVSMLQSILKLAVSEIPFYKNCDWKDLTSFPIVNKDVIKGNYESFQNLKYDGIALKTHHTSGSTGTPFFIKYSPQKITANHASLILHNSEQGYSLGDKLYYFRAWNKSNQYSPLKRFITGLRMQDATASDKNVDSFIRRLKGKNNVLLVYVSALVSYAKNIVQRGKTEKVKGKVKAIITGSEVLTDRDRAFLYSVFECPVMSRYSNEENGIIAQQVSMQTSSFRVNTPCVWVEILKMDSDEPAAPGEMGRIVVTDFQNDAMPIIRYDTGDLSSYDKGGKYKDSIVSINNIDGRAIDMLCSTSGEQISGYHVNNLMADYMDSISTYQLLQKSLHDLDLKYVPNASQLNTKKLLNDLQHLFGEGVNINLIEVEDIPLLRSGKRRYIINEINKA